MSEPSELAHIKVDPLLAKIGRKGWSESLAGAFERQFGRQIRWLIVVHMQKLGFIFRRLNPDYTHVFTTRRLELFENTLSDLWMALIQGLANRYADGVTAGRIHQEFPAYLSGTIRHLVIIPSDILFYVPFAALYQCPDETDLYKEAVTRCAGETDGSPPTGQFLIERFTLSYAPSLASLCWPLQHEGDGSYTSVLSVGNPTGDLLAAQTEATTVAALFPDSTLLLREEGTEARVKEELVAREYDVVHLSTHGLFDPTMPLLSEVVFREGGGEDGHLYAGEILGLSLSHTEIVVMSACQTALPPEISQDVVVGDEIQGLGQALFVAGVPTALLTLWNVNDASTGELMVEFYQELMSGQAKAEALAEAQRALLRGDYGLAYRHPYYWAPFVMYGDWR